MKKIRPFSLLLSLLLIGFIAGNTSAQSTRLKALVGGTLIDGFKTIQK